MKSMFLIVGLFLFSEAFANGFLLTNARVIDPFGEFVTEKSLFLKDGRIQNVTLDRNAFAGAEVVDLKGKWVMPSFVDMHVHAFGNVGPNNAYEGMGLLGSAKVMQRAGIGAFLDLFNFESIFEERNRQRENLEPQGAEIFAAGPCLTAPEGHCSEYSSPTRIVETPEGAVAEVREVAKFKPDVIKLVYDHFFSMPSLNKETMRALVGEANRLKIKTVVHIGTWQDAKEVAEAGATAITHLNWDVAPDDVVALLKEKNVYVIPTLAVQTEIANIKDDPSLLDDPLLVSLASAEIRNSYRNIDDSSPAMQRFLQFQRKCRETGKVTMEKLSKAGVPLMTGTDIGNFGTFVGFTLHREMELFTRSVSNWKALQAATVVPGRFLGTKIGSREGDLANLVVLDANPLDDIRNTKKIHMVFQRGQPVSH